MEHTSLLGAYFVALRKFSDYSGRSARREFWGFVLVAAFLQLLSLLAVIVLAKSGLDNFFAGESLLIIPGIVAAFHIIPGAAVMTRRFHDLGLSGIMTVLFAGFGGVFSLISATRVLARFGVLGLAVLLCTLLGVSGLQWTLGHEDHKGGEAYGLMLLASCGALLMTQAIDFVSLFIAMELTSFPVYALVGIRRKDSNAGEGVFKYFVSGSIFSAIFLYGVALVYGATGTTHFSALILQGREPIYAIGILLTIFGLLFKAGAAPFHFWVADVYTGTTFAVTGFMAAVVKVGALAALGSVWLGMLVAKAASAPAWNLSEPVTVASQSRALFLVVLIVALLSMVIGLLPRDLRYRQCGCPHGYRLPGWPR